MIFGGGSVGGGTIGTGIVFTLYDEFSKTSDTISQKMQNLDGITEKAMGNINASLVKMKLGFASMVAGAAIIGALSFPVSKAADFEQQLSSIKAVSGATNAEMATMKSLSLQLGKDTKYSALESAQGIEELIKAGISLDQVVHGGVQGALSLAAAGEIEVADAAEIASTALNAFKNDALSVTQAADILAGAANASATDVMGLKLGLSQASAVASGLKMSFLDTSTGLALFAQNGLKGSDAGTSFKNMLLNLIPTTKAQITLSKQLGLITKDGSNAFFDQNGKLKSLAGIADTVQTAFSGLSDEQRTAAMITLFGSDAIRASNILYKEGTKGVNDMQSAMTKFTAAGVAAERMNNFNGALEQFKGSWETLMIVIGGPFLKPLQLVMGVFQRIVDLMTSFAQTKIGKFFFLLAGAIGVAALALGLYVVAMNLATFAAGKLGFAFLELGMQQVGLAFIQGGLTAGTYALATAIWTALAPLLPFIAAIAAVVGVVYLAYKGFKDFNSLADGTGKKLEGVRGFFQKTGGAIQGFIEIWSSATDEGFSLSQKTHDALQKIGMLEFVLNMSTWIGRLRAIWIGFKDTIVPILVYAWDKFKEVFSQVKAMFISVVESLGFNITKLTGSLESFKNIGRVIAIMVLVPIILLLFALSAAAIFVAGIVLIVVGVFWALYQVIMFVWALLTGFVKFWIAVFTFMADIVMAFVNFFKDIFVNQTTFAEAGHNLVEGLKAGILSAWDSLKGLMIGLIKSLPFGDKILGWLGIDAGFSEGQSPQGNVAPQDYNNFGGMTGLSTMTGQQNSAKTNQGDGSMLMMPKSKNQKSEIKLTVNLDGREIKSSIDKHEEEDQSRD